MDNLATKFADIDVSNTVGTVLHLKGDEYIVRTACGDWRAQPAASCVITPAAGDQVLLAILEPEGCFILAILTRTAEQTTRMCVPGDLELAIPGEFKVSAQQGMKLASSAGCSIAAKEFVLNAGHSTLLSRQLDLVSGVLRAELAEIKTFAERCDLGIGRLMQRVKESFRFVTGTEQVRAERLDYVAEESLRMHAKDTLLTAEQLIKADADQIHLG